MDSCPDFFYELVGVALYTADDELDPGRLGFLLATARFRADLIDCRWQVRLLDGRQQEGYLKVDELYQLRQLVDGMRQRVTTEGPTCCASEVKAFVREVVDRSIAASLA